MGLENKREERNRVWRGGQDITAHGSLIVVFCVKYKYNEKANKREPFKINKINIVSIEKYEKYEKNEREL